MEIGNNIGLKSCCGIASQQRRGRTIFFIIYINDIVQASKIFDFIIYADDTTLSTTLEIV